MNKFLWRLFGIDEDEIPDPSRRGFLKILGGGAIVGAVAPKYFFAPKGGWNSSSQTENFQFGFSGYKDLSVITNDFIVPQLADNFFKSSPIFQKLRSNVAFHGGSEIRNPIQFSRVGSL
jgi:hypothetical protein